MKRSTFAIILGLPVLLAIGWAMATLVYPAPSPSRMMGAAHGVVPLTDLVPPGVPGRKTIVSGDGGAWAMVDAGGVSTVTGNAPISCSGAPTATCSIATSSGSGAGSMSSSAYTKLGNLEAGVTSISGDCVGSGPGASTLTCAKATGSDGGFGVAASYVAWPSAQVTGVASQELSCATSACTMPFPVPSNTSGFVDVLYVVRQGDGGVNAGGGQWRCGVANVGGTCKQWSACTATTAFSSTDAGGAFGPASVTLTSCSIVVTAPSISGLHFASTVQRVVVQ